MTAARASVSCGTYALPGRFVVVLQRLQVELWQALQQHHLAHARHGLKHNVANFALPLLHALPSHGAGKAGEPCAQTVLRRCSAWNAQKVAEQGIKFNLR